MTPAEAAETRGGGKGGDERNAAIKCSGWGLFRGQSAAWGTVGGVGWSPRSSEWGTGGVGKPK